MALAAGTEEASAAEAWGVVAPQAWAVTEVRVSPWAEAASEAFVPAAGVTAEAAALPSVTSGAEAGAAACARQPLIEAA